MRLSIPKSFKTLALAVPLTAAFFFSLPLTPAMAADPLYIHGGGGGAGGDATDTTDGAGGGGGGALINTSIGDSSKTGKGGAGAPSATAGAAQPNITAGAGEDGDSANATGGVGANGGADIIDSGLASETITSTTNNQKKGKGAAAGAGGGAGGGATVTNADASLDSISILGGYGGNAGNYTDDTKAAGGAGGSVTYNNTAAGAVTIDNGLVVKGGQGGASAVASSVAKGGAGGNASISTTGDVTVTAGDVEFTGQAGGAAQGTPTGNGGAGGGATGSFGGALTVTNGDLKVQSGTGGTTGSAEGGAVSLTAKSLTVTGSKDATFQTGASSGSFTGNAGDISVSLSQGETSTFGKDLTLKVNDNANSTSDSGKGGSITWNNGKHNVEVTGNFTATAGTGATGGTGAGGKIEFKAENLTLKGTTNSIASGADGAGGATGGEMDFSVNKLNADNAATAFTVTKGTGGVLKFSAEEVWATAGSLTLTLDTNIDTAAGDTSSVDKLNVGNGKTLKVVAADAKNLSFNSLNVYAFDSGDLNAFVSGTTYEGSGSSANFTGKGLNFYFPEQIAKDSVILTATNAISVDNTTKIGLNMVGSGGPKLNVGEKITLISDITGSTYAAKDQDVQGSAYKYGFTVKDETNKLTATFNGRVFDEPAAHNFLLGKTAGLSLARDGGDTVVDAIANQSSLAAADWRNTADTPGSTPDVQYITFGEIGGGHYKSEPGSEVKSDNLHIMVGPGLRFNNSLGLTSVGVFFEAGWGDFDVSNSSYDGDGDTSYYGGGVLLRHDMTNGFHAELSGRIGSVKTEYNADWSSSSYDSSSAYYGGHLGLGYELPITDNGSVDFNGRMLWTHVDSDSLENSADEKIKFKASDSVRSQLGADYRYHIQDAATFYVGAYWEHEFEGDSKMTLDSFDVEKTSMDGSSFIGRAGLEYKPTEHFAFGLGVHGVAGEREGGGASFNLRLEF